MKLERIEGIKAAIDYLLIKNKITYCEAARLFNKYKDIK